MKILRFYTKLPPLPGGMEKHIKSLSLHQIDQGNKVKVFFNQGNKVSDIDSQILGGIKLYKIKPQFVAFVVFYFAVISHLLVNRTRADVLHIHGDWSSLVFVQLIKKLTGAKVSCFSFHSEFLPNKITHTKFLIRLLKKTNVVLVNGHGAYTEIKERLKRSDGNIFFRPSGISSNFMSIRGTDKTGKFKVISVANLVKRKNLCFILNIAKLSPNLDFYIVGEGAERESLTARITNEQISNVYLLGQKSEMELVVLLNSADLFLLTSFAEGTPTAIIEAMACGLPIICSNAGNIEILIVNKENGFVLNNFDEKEYLEKTYLIKDNVKLKEKIQKNNLKKAQEYNWEKVSKEISVLFEKALIRNC